MDEGYDESNNPFAGVSEEYTRKKEEAMEAKKVGDFLNSVDTEPGSMDDNMQQFFLLSLSLTCL